MRRHRVPTNLMPGTRFARDTLARAGVTTHDGRMAEEAQRRVVRAPRFIAPQACGTGCFRLCKGARGSCLSTDRALWESFDMTSRGTSAELLAAWDLSGTLQTRSLPRRRALSPVADPLFP
jgi:hypothetical protein